MPNWSTNHTVFIGNTATLDLIEKTVSDGEFDFDQLRPRPEVYNVYSTPVRTVSNEEFTKKYGFDAPETIADLIKIHKLRNANLKDGEYEKQFSEIPESVHRLIQETHTYDDWYDWCVANWGTKWTGCNVHVERHLPNLLTVDYDTAWSAPMPLFSYLEEQYPDLQIINGSILEDFSDEVEVTNGCDTAFRTYYSVSITTTIEPYDFNSAGRNIRGVEVYTDNECAINAENITVMKDAGFLVDADGESLEINKLK